jgi:hypothetical protein
LLLTGQSDVVRDARIVAEARSVNMTSYITSVMSAVVNRDLKKIEKPKDVDDGSTMDLG